MIFFNPQHMSPGEHALFFPGKMGLLEAVLAVPEQMDTRYLALLGHPHSLQGGTMNNKVVTTLVRACNACRVASIRFNFRGVGLSEGVYDHGIGESEDLLILANLCAREWPGVRFIFAGFSFGSYVAYRAAAQHAHDLLITIAPPVHHFDYQAFQIPPGPWVVLQGEEDEVVPLDIVRSFIHEAAFPIDLQCFSKTGHFFHGQLVNLKARLIALIQARIDVHVD